MGNSTASEVEELRAEIRSLKEQLAASEQARQVAGAIDVMVEGLQVIDRSWRYTYVNEAAARHGRSAPGELTGRTMMERYPGIEKTAMFALLEQSMADGRRRWMQNQFTYPDGGDGWFELLVDPIPAGLIILSVDITERKRDEEKLRKAQELEVQNRELESFSYSVAHDLRAPLRSISGFSQILLEDSAHKLDDGEKEHLNRISRAAGRMGELIEDLLTLARITQAELHREHVDLSALAEATCARLQAAEPDRKVKVVIAGGLQVRADGRLVQVVFDNLFDNAWKFTRKTVDATIEFGREGSTYYVRDNGAGFDMAYQAKLFGPFQRLHPAKEFEGTGIGLATVHRVIRRHGGRISAQGAVGAGATFSFTLEDE